MITIVTKRHRVCPTPTLDMSAEFDDVLTNQPIVIDNVRSHLYQTARERVLTIVSPLASPGIWNDKSRFCWSRSSKMFLPVFVRFHG